MTPPALLLSAPWEPLEEFGRALGIPRNGEPWTWAGQETLDKITVPADTWVTRDAVAAAIDAILNLVRSYGDALIESGLRLEGFPQRLDFAPTLDRDQLQGFLEGIGTNLNLTLELTLDKRKLVRERLPVPAGHRPELFFYLSRLESILRGKNALRNLESWWDARNPEKVVLLVPAWQGLLDGPYLALIGKDPLASWARVVSTPPNPPVTPPALYKACRDNLKWQTGWLRHLTPLHLMASVEKVPASDRIADTLRVHRADLCILFTADWSQDDPTQGGWSAHYIGARQQVEVPLVGVDHSLPAEAAAGVQALERIVLWAYEPRYTSDRLSFTQNAVAAALQSTPVPGRFDALVRRASSLLKDIEPYWKLFMEGKVDEFTAEVQSLEGSVAGTVQAFSEQTSSVIRSLSEAMLAAVAVVLGSFIAALFSDQSDPEILKIGIYLYLVYLLVFPLALNMSERWSGYAALRDQFSERRRRFEERLYPEKVEEIVGGQVERSQDRFRFWFWLTVVVYLAVAAALWTLIPPPAD